MSHPIALDKPSEPDVFVFLVLNSRYNKLPKDDRFHKLASRFLEIEIYL